MTGSAILGLHDPVALDIQISSMRDGGVVPLAALLGALCFVALTASVSAAEGDEAGARALFGEGRKLADAGRYAEACLKFEDSLRLDPGVGTSFNLADCQEHLGLTASAWARFLEVASATKRAGQFERERVARARASALEPKLARLLVEVNVPVEGLVVDRDGLPVDPATWGTAVPVDPGPHVVEARAPERRVWSETTIVPNGPATVVVSVPTLGPKAPPVDSSFLSAKASLAPAAPPPANQAALAFTHRWSFPVVACGGLAMAGLVTAGVFALKLHSANGQAKVLCSDSRCLSVEEKTKHDTLVSDAHVDRTVAFVGAGVGAAALLAGGYFWWRAGRPPSVSGATGKVSAHPTTGPPGATLEIAW